MEKKKSLFIHDLKVSKICEPDTALRFRTSDAKVAKVNANGKVTAKGKGQCVVWVQAVNGLWKKVTVIVK